MRSAQVCCREREREREREKRKEERKEGKPENPPTPAASRGSASEEALLATRGEERKLDKQEEKQKGAKFKVWS